MSADHGAGAEAVESKHERPKHELSAHAKRVYAIRDLLLEKGVLTKNDIQEQVEGEHGIEGARRRAAAPPGPGSLSAWPSRMGTRARPFSTPPGTR